MAIGRSLQPASLGLAVAVLALALVGIGASGCAPASTDTTGEVPTQSETSAPANTAERGIGQTLSANGFTIKVRSAGSANMPDVKGAPAEGNRYVAVRVDYANKSGKDVAINGVPFDVYNTVLTVDGTDYPGALTSSGVRVLRQGVVPSDATLDLRFVFEVPERSREATFVWPPSSSFPELPTLVVPLPDGSLGK